MLIDQARLALITRLRDIQGSQSLERFGATIGVDKAMLWRIYQGERDLSRNVLGAIVVRYPDLKPVVDEYLVSCGEAALMSTHDQ